MTFGYKGIYRASSHGRWPRLERVANIVPISGMELSRDI